jgi:hypothetical protein
MDNADTLWQHWSHKTQDEDKQNRRDNQEWTMQRHSGNIGYTSRRQTKQKRQSKMDNAETLWQHWVHKTQDEDNNCQCQIRVNPSIVKHMKQVGSIYHYNYG